MSGKTQIFGDQIVNGTITNAQISASATIDSSKITPPGSTLQLSYNNAGVFAGTANITTNGTNLTLSSTAGSVQTFTTPNPGANSSTNQGTLLLTSGDTNFTNNSGTVLNADAKGTNLTLTSGNTAATGAGNGTANAIGGTLTLTAGNNTGTRGSSTGASLLLTAGNSANSNSNGGSITLTTGNGGSNNGGSITLTTATGAFTTTGGGVTLTAGDSGSIFGGSAGGSLTLSAGLGGAGGSQGGSILLTSGTTQNGGLPNGGNVTLTASTATRGGNLVLTGTIANHGQVTVGGSTPSASASVDIQSTTRGFLPPRMTTVQKNAISTPATGLIVYDTDLGYFQEYNGSIWTGVAPGSPPAGANTQIQFNNSGAFGASSSLTWDGTTFTTTKIAGTEIDVNGTKAIDLTVGTGRALVTSGGAFVLDWQNQLLATAGGTSIDWNNRQLRGTTGTLAMSWATAGVTLASAKSLTFTDSGSNTITLQAPTTITSSYTLKYPIAQGGANTAMVNDGSGNLSWGTTGTGSVTQNTYTVGTPLNTYTGSTTVFNLPFTYVQDGKSLQVMYNGQVLVSGVDYSETSNTSVTFTSALTVGFTAQFRYITPQSPSNTSVAQFQNYVIGTASGTYTGSLTVYNLPFAYTQDAKSLEIYYDGIQLIPGDDYTETTSTSITTTQALVSGQKIAFRTISTIGNAAAVTALRENYVVGTPSGNYTGSTTVFNLISSYTPGGINLQVYLDGDLQTVGAGNDYVETNSTTVTFNFTLTASQTVTFLFSQTVAATGTVTSATAGQLAYYPSTGSTVAGTNDPAGIASIGSTFIGMGRNRFINGDMNIDQKYAGAAATANNSTLGYVPDMFLLLSNFGGALEGVMTVQRQSATPPTGFLNYARITVTTADASISAANAYEYLSAIEGNNVRDLLFGSANAKPVSLSFWVRSSLTGTFGGGIVNEAQDRSYVFQYTINAANTWERKTVSLAGDTTGTWVTGTGRGVQLFWDMGSGSNFEGTASAWNGAASAKWRAAGNTRLISTNGATWDMTGVQFEVGSISTAFEYRFFAFELQLCQRYYEKSYPLTAAEGEAGVTSSQAWCPAVQNGGAYQGVVSYKVPKRVAPTVTLYNNQSGVAGSWRALSTAGTDGDITVTAANTGINEFSVLNGTNSSPNLHGHWVSNAGLQ